MAKAIQYTQVPPSPKEQLEAETLRSQEALEEALELLRELHERGGLDLVLKLLRGGPNLAAATLDKVNEPGIVQGLRNLLTLAEALGGIDPDELKVVVGALGEGVHSAAQAAKTSEHLGLRRTAYRLRNPDVQLASNVGLGFLEGMGHHIRTEGMNVAHGKED